MSDQPIFPATPYERPRIEAKTSIEAPLVAVSSDVACAAFFIDDPRSTHHLLT